MGQHCGIWQTERCCLNISSVKDKADWNNKSRSNLVASTWVGVTMWRHSAVGSMFVHILKLIPFNLFFLSLASIPVPRIWILDSAKYEQVTFATLPRFTAVSGVYASMCVCVCMCVFVCVCVCVRVCVCARALLARGLGAFASANGCLLPVRRGPAFLQPCSSWEHWLYHLQQLNQYFNGKLQRRWVFGNQSLPTKSRK